MKDESIFVHHKKLTFLEEIEAFKYNPPIKEKQEYLQSFSKFYRVRKKNLQNFNLRKIERFRRF